MTAPQWLFTIWVLTMVLSAVFFALRERRYKRHRDCAARADFEHWSLLNGDPATGIYGAFRPARL